jgi:hypothetical protein
VGFIMEDTLSDVGALATFAIPFDGGGWNLVLPGDLDGDGLTEAVLGLPGQAEEAGQVAVFASWSAAGGDVAYEDADGFITGVHGSVDGFGNVIAPSVDCDDDGLGDLIAAPYAASAGGPSGVLAYLHPGPVVGNLATDDATARWTVSRYEARVFGADASWYADLGTVSDIRPLQADDDPELELSLQVDGAGAAVFDCPPEGDVSITDALLLIPDTYRPPAPLGDVDLDGVDDFVVGLVHTEDDYCCDSEPHIFLSSMW